MCSTDLDRRCDDGVSEFMYRMRELGIEASE